MNPAPTTTAITGDRPLPWLQIADRETLTRFQLIKLRAGLARALRSNRFLRDKLDGFDIERLTSLEALASLPFMNKRELVEDQRACPPYGANLTFSPRDYVRLH